MHVNISSRPRQGWTLAEQSLLQGRTDPASYLMVSGKATAAKAGDLLALFRDVLLNARLDDKARFKQACPSCFPVRG